jgi:hypothetical protein
LKTRRLRITNRRVFFFTKGLFNSDALVVLVGCPGLTGATATGEFGRFVWALPHFLGGALFFFITVFFVFHVSVLCGFKPERHWFSTT